MFLIYKVPENNLFLFKNGISSRHFLQNESFTEEYHSYLTKENKHGCLGIIVFAYENNKFWNILFLWLIKSLNILSRLHRLCKDTKLNKTQTR